MKTTATIIRSKDLFAKILASENITIDRCKHVKTAYFDVRNRVLVLPNWHFMTEDINDMLLCHEVGHALHTPQEGWHNSVTSNPSMKPYLNIVEDARIERLIKTAFPGTIGTFERAYFELQVERDFFKLKGIDVSTLSFADRFNFTFKVGHIIPVAIKNGEEASMIEEGSRVTTWEEVVALAKRMYEYDRVNGFDPQAMPDGMPQIGDGEEGDASQTSQTMQMPTGDSDEEGEEGEGQGSGDSDSDEEGEEGEGQGSGDSDEQGELKGKDTDNLEANSSGNASAGGNQRGTTHVDEYRNAGYSDDLHRAFENAAVSSSSSPRTSMSFRDFAKQGKHRMLNEYTHVAREFLAAPDLVDIIGGNNKPIIDLMVRTFEAKKAARREERKTISKTGRINAARLSRYKTSADVFKRIAVRGRVKNHGVVMVLDNSQSMGRAWSIVFKQALQIGDFCSRVGIPCVAKSFTDTVFDTREANWRSKISLKSHRLIGHTPMMTTVASVSEDIAQMYDRGTDIVTLLALTDGHSSDGHLITRAHSCDQQYVVNKDNGAEYVVCNNDSHANDNDIAAFGVLIRMICDTVGRNNLNSIFINLMQNIRPGQMAGIGAEKLTSSQWVLKNYLGVNRILWSKVSSLGFAEYSPTPNAAPTTAGAKELKQFARQFQDSMEDARDARLMAREIADSIALGL